METPKTVEAYIMQFPGEMRERMRKMREIIRAAAPDAAEIIRWEMPTYKGKRNLVHFAGHKKHIGFYPGADGVEHFIKELGEFRTSKGTIQFPNDAPLPLDLIKKITEFCVEEDKKG